VQGLCSFQRGGKNNLGLENIRMGRCGDLTIVVPPVKVTHRTKKAVGESLDWSLDSVILHFHVAVVQDSRVARLSLPAGYPMDVTVAKHWPAMPLYGEPRPYLEALLQSSILGKHCAAFCTLPSFSLSVFFATLNVCTTLNDV
jgi:hypothetical protein